MPRVKKTADAAAKSTETATSPASKKAASKKTSAVKPKSEQVKKERKPGSGARIRELLLQGKTADEILPIIKKEFPAGNTQKGDVSWNAWKLRKEGHALTHLPTRGRKTKDAETKSDSKKAATTQPASKKAASKKAASKKAASKKATAKRIPAAS